MGEISENAQQRNYFDQLFERLVAGGTAASEAVAVVAAAYLDGKPQGKRKLSGRERDELFWTSRVCIECPDEAWHGEAMVLALARYIGQDSVARAGLPQRVARAAPDALVRAVRYSGLVTRQQSPRCIELQQAAVGCPQVAELCRVLKIFDVAYRERLAAVETLKDRLAGLSAFELLIYASLYAFERLVPREFEVKSRTPGADHRVQVAWDAINDLIAWKLQSATEASLKLNVECIGRSIAQHLRPILFEPGKGSSKKAEQTLGHFHALTEAQIELNDFIGRSADAFSYDDSVRFERRENRLEIVVADPELTLAWQRDGRRLERLHGYWFYRALDAFVESVAAEPSGWDVGRPENGDANRLAWVRALQTQLRLREAYGVADKVLSESDESVNLFRALLSLNLMSAFYMRDFLADFARCLDASGHWISALQRLVMNGLHDNMQNRLPLTWSGRDAKVRNITAWTVTADEPQGNPRMAALILDFWTYDLADIAGRLQRHEPGIQPHLFERPVLKFGTTLVQLPWIVGMQNTSTAAINNLRRLGTQRGEVGDETRRIEENLARLLESRGFSTRLNWKLPPEDGDPGEVDVIAIHGKHLFVFEMKSTFIRRTQRDAWNHAATTLRKAGQQLRRNVTAVSLAINADIQLRAALRLSADWIPDHLHGWIVDTSIECDHQHFSGFLKISFEEILIALRDDRHLLNDPRGLLAGGYNTDEQVASNVAQSTWTLYPGGFSVERFVEVIETEAVWDETATSNQ